MTAQLFVLINPVHSFSFIIQPDSALTGVPVPVYRFPANAALALTGNVDFSGAWIMYLIILTFSGWTDL